MRLAHRDGGAAKTVHADVVVDATGRGSTTPTFLEALGYSRPLEDEVVVHLTYEPTAPHPRQHPARAAGGGLP